jgi:uncharacterized protein YjiK
MHLRSLLCGLFFSTLLIGQGDFQFPYNLSHPSRQFTLPSILHEISGLTEIDSTSFACIQDENGVIFIYNLRRGEISRELAFAYDGDYEGVARVGRSLFVLRSDGALFEVPDLKAPEANTKYHLNAVPARNNEGLCYDKARNRLLLGSKGKVEDESRLTRVIYAFDLERKVMLADPAFRFNVASVSRFAADRGLIEPVKITAKGRTIPNYIKFQTSEIAIHPLTNDLYVLSANDFMLLIFDQKGRIRDIQKLDPVLFNKAEGITFLANGDMLITNEGQSREPSLLRFAMTKKPRTNEAGTQPGN